ncbi:hypothetical protein JCM11491_001763 [Sporobolomyces phaffii]
MLDDAVGLEGRLDGARTSGTDGEIGAPYDRTVPAIVQIVDLGASVAQTVGPPVMAESTPEPSNRRATYEDPHFGHVTGSPRRSPPAVDYDDPYDQLQREAEEEDDYALSDDDDSDGAQSYSETAASRSRFGAEIPGLLGEEQVLPKEEFGEITIKGAPGFGRTA